MADVVEQAVEAFHAKCLVDAVTIEAAAAATTTTTTAGAAAASSSSSQQSLDSSSFAFPKFRDVWKEKNLTSEVLNLVGACSSARDACETVQSLMLSCIHNLSFEPGSWNSAEKTSRLIKQIAGVYAAYIIYSIQPITPKVRIYLPVTFAHQLWCLLWECRKIKLFDCHTIATELLKQDAFVYGGLSQEWKGKKSGIARKQKQAFTFEMWKQAKEVEGLAKTCLSNMESQMDKDLYRQYNEGLWSVTGSDKMCTDILDKVAKWQKELNAQVKEKIDEISTGPQWREEYSEVFGSRKPYTYQNKKEKGVQAGTDGMMEEGEISNDEYLKGLPARLRKKIKDVMKAEKERQAKEKRKGESSGGKRSRSGGKGQPAKKKAAGAKRAKTASKKDVQTRSEKIDEDDDYDDDNLAAELEAELEGN